MPAASSRRSCCLQSWFGRNKWAVRSGSRRGVSRDPAHESAIEGRHEFGRSPADPIRHFLSLRLLTTLLALVIIFAITRILVYDRGLSAVIAVVSVVYAIDAISDVYYAQLQRCDRMAEISKSLIARSLLSVIALAFATYFSRSLLWELQVLPWLGQSFFMDTIFASAPTVEWNL